MTSGGYVGLSLAVLLAQHHQVTALDIVPEKVEMINNKKSPIRDEYIEKYLAEKELDLTATLDAKEAYSDADFVVIAAPTNYDSNFRLNLKNVRADSISQIFSNLCGDAAGGEVSNKSFAHDKCTPFD